MQIHRTAPGQELTYTPSEVEESKQVPKLNPEAFSGITDKPGLLKVQSGNAWMEDAAKRAIPNELFQKFWFENELCILFGDSNTGKSILAVMIALKIAEVQKAMYIDFELSDKQFEARYSQNYTNHYRFPDNLFRAEMNADAEFDENASFEDQLLHAIEHVILSTGIRVFIIDNITYLGNETDKAKFALPLMKRLKALKKKYDLSLLVLAHTPKRDLTKPLTQNDLAGSKMLINFCDSAFAIGTSQRDSSLRYLKQIKQRNCEQVYGADNVMLYRITKPENILFMAFEGVGCEREHLKVISEAERDDIKMKVKELASKNMTQREIATTLSIGLGTVNKYIKD
jgi:predicted ATP-dependent serine protease